MLVSDDAIILQTFPYSETSKIVKLFTRTHGFMSVLARGALRPKNRYGGVLEPFTEGIATAYVKSGRELQSLSGFDLVRSRQALGRDLIRFGGASLVAELLLRTSVEQADAELFDAVRNALNQVEVATSQDVESVLLSVTWQLAGVLGFAPALESCVVCSRVPSDDESVLFEYAAGGIRCTSCMGSGAARELPPEARSTLMRFMNGDTPVLERTSAHWALLGKFLGHHVVETSPLRSLQFIAEALERQACAG